MHLSCTDTNTVSKWTEIEFDMTHITLEFHRVCPKWLSSLWYVQRKLCTYLVSRFTLSPNGLKRASTWGWSPSSTIGSVQNNSWAYGTFSATRAPILHRLKHRLQMDRNKILDDPHHLGVPSSASKMISEPMAHSVQIVHLFVIKISTTSKRTETSFHLGLVTKV
jgi:hypothetical protein